MQRAAFFDLDGTLIKEKSMISFVNYLANHHPGTVNGLNEFIDSLQEHMNRDVIRVNINREYFRIFSGITIESMQRLVSLWAEKFLSGKDIFNDHIVTKLKQHKANNDKIVIVSGSFAILAKQATITLPIDDYLCTQPEVVSGRFTGEVVGPSCIGGGKRAYMLEYALDEGIDLSRSSAYGDDPTDQHMLDTVANGVFV
ncbi:hypothetical protein A9Q81_09890 [Gammaproteobacteria bacterium 42_54_T18]|nr:hypothetical protein A9Q81_09890 [Gammaproteobacteria bacterium 42_54_T18]